MQVSPLLTPINYITKNKKRSRSDDDFESNYFKKRLIFVPLPKSSFSSSLQDTAIIEGGRGVTTTFNNESDSQDTLLLNTTTKSSNENETTPPALYMTEDDELDDELGDFSLLEDSSQAALQQYTSSSSSLSKVNTSRIHMVDVNGTILPMEHKSGETRLSIPDFVVTDSTTCKNMIPTFSISTTTEQQGQLIKYQPNTLLPPTPPTTPPSDTNNEEDYGLEEEEAYEPMDIE